MNTIASTGRALAAMLALAALQPARAMAAPSAGDRAVEQAERRVAQAPSPDALVLLGSAFMQKARETGDPSYYARASAAVERARAIDPAHYGALRARAWVFLGQHRFARALRAARVATHATTRMMALRPGLPAYTRVAALRALFGDRRGAVEALETALDAADPG